MEISKNWEKHLEVLAVGTLCPKISFLAQKLRAVASKETDTHTAKAKLRDPFFLQFIFYYFYWVKPENQKHAKTKGSLIKSKSSIAKLQLIG